MNSANSYSFPFVAKGNVRFGRTAKQNMLDIDSSKVEVGQKAPDFALRTDTGYDWRLSEQAGNVVALLFYPKDETLVCTKQLCSVRDQWQDYLETKATVVGISPGSVEDHRSFTLRHKLPIPLLADHDRAVTEIYGSHWIMPTFFMRSIVIVDAKGIVRSKRSMLRTLRPTDRSVITAIYAARAEALHDRFDELAGKQFK